MNVCYFWDIPDASEISSLSKSPALNPVYLEKAGACLWLAWLLCERMKWQSGLFQDLSPFRLTSCLFDSVLGSDHWELLTPCLGQDALLVSKPPTWLSLKLLQVYALLALLAVVILLGFPSSSAAMQETWVHLLGWEDPWVGRMARPPTPVFFGFPGGSAGKESACNVGDLGSIPGLGRSPGEENGNPLQCFAWKIPWTEVPGRL